MTVIVRMLRRIGDQVVARALELPVPPAIGLQLVVGEGNALVITAMKLAPLPAWCPGLLLPLVEVELQPEPAANLPEALGAGWTPA